MNRVTTAKGKGKDKCFDSFDEMIQYDVQYDITYSFEHTVLKMLKILCAKKHILF